MGIFSKKTYVCQKCGKEYEARLDIRMNTCKECYEKEIENMAQVQGYIDYNKKSKYIKSFSQEDYKKIKEHRQAILDKYHSEYRITKEELRVAGTNYKRLTDDECRDIIEKIGNASTTSLAGAAYNKDIFILAGYQNVIVDIEDIFAVGYLSVNDFRVRKDGYDIVWCVFFTNDPYVPVFPMLFEFRKSFLDFRKSKKGREAINILFENICPNLAYPVGELKNLKKIIKEENAVRGLINMNYMLEKISDASSGYGIFDIMKAKDKLQLDNVTKIMLDENGYILEEEIDRLLKYNNIINKKFWDKQMQRILAENEMVVK